MKIFVSYVKEDREIAGRLTSDLNGLGHEAWQSYDYGAGLREQLEGIREPFDLLVFLISKNILNSGADRQIIEDFSSQNIQVLPVFADDTAPDELPPLLARQMSVDYRGRNPAEEAKQLGRVLKYYAEMLGFDEPHEATSDATPLSSPLADIRAQIENHQFDPDNQDQVIAELETALESEATRADALDLLRFLRDLVMPRNRVYIDVLLSEYDVPEAPNAALPARSTLAELRMQIEQSELTDDALTNILERLETAATDPAHRAEALDLLERLRLHRSARRYAFFGESIDEIMETYADDPVMAAELAPIPSWRAQTRYDLPVWREAS